MNQMSLIVLLDQLETMLKAAPQVPLSGRGLIDVDAALATLERIRATFPVQIRQAEHVASEQGKMLDESRKRAERIVTAAEEHAAALVNESEIIKTAKAQAQQLVDQARDNAQELESGAQAYAEETLAQLESILKKALVTIQNGRSELTNR